MSYIQFNDVEKLRRAFIFLTENVEELRAKGIEYLVELENAMQNPEGAETPDAEELLKRKATEIGDIIANGAFGCQQENVRQMMSLLLNYEVPREASAKADNSNSNPFNRQRTMYYPGLCWIISSDRYRNGLPTFYVTDEDTSTDYSPCGIVQRNIMADRLASSDVANTDPDNFRLATREEITQAMELLKLNDRWDSRDRLSIRSNLYYLSEYFYPKYAEVIDAHLGMEAINE